MKHPSRIIGIALLAALAAATWWKLSSSRQTTDTRRPSVVQIKAAVPTREAVVYTLSFTGDVLAAQKAEIYARVGGNLQEVFVNAGDWVRRGAVLAQIDTTELVQQLLQSSATLQNAKSSYNRARELAGKQFAAQQELDNAQTALQIAQSAYESTRLRVGYATITAPFSGFITRRLLDPGALVGSGNSGLFTLMDMDVVKVTVEVLEKDVPRVRKGMAASVAVDAYTGKVFQGRIARLSESVDLNTRTMAVEVEVPNPDHLLKPGMFGAVTVTLDTHSDALTVPASAVQKDDDGYYLWTVRNGQAGKQRVAVGEQAGFFERTEIVSGLAPGDSVVTVGIQLLRDGGRVIISK